MKSLILAFAILCGAAACEAAEPTFYFDNGNFSFSIGPQPRYYRPAPAYPPVYSPYYAPTWPPYYGNPYYAPPAKYPPRHYHAPAPRPSHGHGRHHRGCN